MQFASGGCAGFVEVSIMHPLDLIKTRFQIQRGPDDPHRYSSLRDCCRKMYRTEGALSFYKGILPPLLAETPKRAVKFFTYEKYKIMFANIGSLSDSVVITLAGLSSGLTEAVIINPFEVVKVQLQADRRNVQRSTFATAKDIIAHDGVSALLFKGITSTLGRHGIFNMIYFSFYFNMRSVIPEFEDKTLDFARKFAIGLCAGVLGSCINIPFDVAKSRIQGPQPVPGQVKYRTCFATIRTIYMEEGYLALYKGLLPKILRLGPGGAIMLLVNEYAFKWMSTNFL